MLKEDYYRITPVVFNIIMSQIFCWSTEKKTLPQIYSLVESRQKFLIDSHAKFRLLGSKILHLEVTNRSRP